VAHQHQREEWQREIENRQPNVVFPDTVKNEARFWKNVGNPPWTPLTRVGLGILAIFAAGFLGSYIVASVQAGHGLEFVMGMLLICARQ
jgi:hypothetical protein